MNVHHMLKIQGILQVIVKEALRLNPEFPKAYFGLGSVYFCLGSYERAAQALIKAVYLDHELIECMPQKMLLKVRQGVSRLR